MVSAVCSISQIKICLQHLSHRLSERRAQEIFNNMADQQTGACEKTRTRPRNNMRHHGECVHSAWIQFCVLEHNATRKKPFHCNMKSSCGILTVQLKTLSSPVNPSDCFINKYAYCAAGFLTCAPCVCSTLEKYPTILDSNVYLNIVAIVLMGGERIASEHGSVRESNL